MKTKIYLFGRHSEKTPFYYTSYRHIFSKYFDYTEDIDQANILIFGFSKDIFDGITKISAAQKKNPAIKLIVLSEEPLWDSLWSKGFLQKKVSIQHKGITVSYYNLNHFTSNIFSFKKIPYFITTHNDFFNRYGSYFQRNKNFSTNKIYKIWEEAVIRKAFFAEKRLGKKYNIAMEKQDLLGLCTFRTEVAENVDKDKLLLVGQGWDEISSCQKRQSLADWHLDKLATLDKQSYVVSGIENTHFPSYITEKIFDALLVVGIPLYVASPQHHITKLISDDSFINLYKLPPLEAARRIDNFEPTDTYIKTYHSTQKELANTFSKISDLKKERQHVVDKVTEEVMQVLNLSD